MPGAGTCTLSAAFTIREDAPHPMTVAELWQTHSYGPPTTAPVAIFYPRRGAFFVQTAGPSAGEVFTVAVPVGAQWPPGLYYLEIWATDPSGAQAAVSRRTILVAS